MPHHYEQISVERGRLRELGLDFDALARFLETQPFIIAAYTEPEAATAAAPVR